MRETRRKQRKEEEWSVQREIRLKEKEEQKRQDKLAEEQRAKEQKNRDVLHPMEFGVVKRELYYYLLIWVFYLGFAIVVIRSCVVEYLAESFSISSCIGRLLIAFFCMLLGIIGLRTFLERRRLYLNEEKIVVLTVEGFEDRQSKIYLKWTDIKGDEGASDIK